MAARAACALRAPDVAVVGAGIAGCAAAAFLAEAGARVRVYEREAVAAAASGRNSGVVQHPLDEALAPLFAPSLRHHAATAPGLGLDGPPAGLLVLGEDAAALAGQRRELAERFPDLAVELVEPGELARLEPALAPGLCAVRVGTGHPVPPAAVTRAWAARARAAGAEIRERAAARPVVRGGRVAGVEVDGELHPAAVVLACAGPWTPELVDPAGGWRPVRPLWGAVAEVRLPAPPRHALEESGAEAIARAGGAPPELFSLVVAGGTASVGSTFTAAPPDPAAAAPALLRRGARFVPALAGARPAGARACARPMSADGRPLAGPVAGVDGLHVCTGHGPWGISLGPETARLAARAILDGAAVPPAYAAGRVGDR